MAFTDALRVTVASPTKKTDIDNVALNTEWLQTTAHVDHDFTISTGTGKHKTVQALADSTYNIGAAAARFATIFVDTLGDSGQTLTVSSPSFTIADNFWIGLGSGAGRIEFDDQATDEVNILNARLGINTSTPGALLHVDGGSGTVALFDDGLVIIGDGTTTSKTTSTIGLGIDQRGNDNVAFWLESSDVATGGTSIGNLATTTTDYLVIGKNVAAAGGATIIALSENPGAEGTIPLIVQALGGQAGTTPSTTGTPLIKFFGCEHDGANGLVNAPANSLIFGVTRLVAGAEAAAVFVDAEGDLHVDGSATVGTFDDYPDYQLARAIREGLAPAQFPGSRELFHHYADVLEQADVIAWNRDTDGRPYINLKGLGLFCLDGLHQLGKEVFERQAQEISLLKEQMKLLVERN